MLSLNFPSQLFSWRSVKLLSVAALSAGLVACGGEVANNGETEGSGRTSTVAISGAGATFPAPLFQRWFDTFNRQVDSMVQVSYQSVGSGAGLEQYINGTVDFGASEAPITESADRLKSFKDAYPYEPLQLPLVGGYVIFAYNLPGVDAELKFSRTTYCGIVGGTITNWNDPAIAADNEGVEFPDQPITFVHRSDGSGTTFVFTNHINTICPDWPAGAGTSVDWPVGIGGQGNEGVAAGIQQNEGAIGYLSYAFAQLNNIPVARIENKAGNFPDPLPANASLAFEGVEMPDDFALLVPDPEHPDAYPISGLVWVMVYREYSDANKWDALKEVLEWTLGPEGRAITEELFYVPMPDSIVARIKKELDAVTVK
ncbi:phosphate ABC transporter substrate-binding protein PstS [Spirulina subsalsa FACHB-351]|uniref:Phosphate-binding protein n=1 Tax=Spirulina subsalsa FACHB-351 TaxID=234711 RepID=A0ABT3L820_9CYAN|nr:phosphate ABC transporter substrate-binding protein PstS [Spirulina subsalsa]MCW6037663.1 phosphate ABC transporter substrate-binding protein PstS [Spirulina subsalsa FACHB-351]